MTSAAIRNIQPPLWRRRGWKIVGRGGGMERRVGDGWAVRQCHRVQAALVGAAFGTGIPRYKQPSVQAAFGASRPLWEPLQRRWVLATRLPAAAGSPTASGPTGEPITQPAGR